MAKEITSKITCTCNIGNLLTTELVVKCLRIPNVVLSLCLIFFWGGFFFGFKVFNLFQLAYISSQQAKTSYGN